MLRTMKISPLSVVLTTSLGWLKKGGFLCKKPSFLIPFVLVLVLGASQVSVAVITGVERTGGDLDDYPEVVEAGLVEDCSMYTDRDYKWTEIPEYIVGVDYIKTVNDDVDNQPWIYHVTIGQTAILYLFLEPEAEDNADWMFDESDPDFTQVEGDTINGDKDFNIWVTAPLPAGTYDFGDFSGADQSNYGIAAVATGEPDPNFASHPNPGDGTTVADLTPTLSWSPGANVADADGHNVYFGTDSGNLDLVSLRQTATEWTVTEVLEPGETYYWRVDEVNELHPDKLWTGDVWSFTTTATEPVGCPVGDLDGNCEVNLKDLLLFAQQWLDADGSANLDGFGDVNMPDFALLAESWFAKVGPLVISEFMASNRNTILDGDGESSDWIEIYNPTDATISLDGWYLTDKSDNLTKWQFHSGATIEVGGYLVVFASSQVVNDYIDPGGYYHTNFKLEKDGEYLALVEPDGQTIAYEYIVYEFNPDQFGFPRQVRDISYGLYSGQERYFGTPTPGWDNDDAYLGLVADTKFSHDRGFYDTPFSVTVTTSTGGATIYYTLDGSEPTKTHGAEYDGTAISISTTSCLRAAAFKPSWLPSDVDTHTYIFIDDVVEQPDMDDNVVNSYDVPGALLSIPTLSIVMNENDFFDNLQHQDSGSKEELPTSVELIYPDGREGFQINCAITGHSDSNPKRSFRLKFKREFGPAKLRFPLFESSPVNAESAVTEFDRLVLRSGKNKSWAWEGGDSVTYARDQWQRDAQIAMSGIGSHGIFVHLYVNGRYWGLYNPIERPDAWFTSAYFGGEKEDWFATNHGIERGDTHLSGDSTRFDQMMAMADERDLENPSKYAQFLQLLDVEEYIDYTILFWFSGFGDGFDNNWYAGMQNNPPGGFMMFMWDAEYLFQYGDTGYEGAWVSDYYFTLIEDEYDYTTIVRIWTALLENENFRMLFADRIYKHCFNDGVLTDENSRGRWATITDFIRDAVIGESARWGGGRTRDGHWLPAVAQVDSVMQGNVQQFMDALHSWSPNPHYPGIDLYPDIDPPTFNQHGGPVPSGFSLIMDNPNGSGTIYYTTDGSDPRLYGGGVSPSATIYTSPIPLTESVDIKARSLGGSTWSALNEAVFAVGPSPLMAIWDFGPYAAAYTETVNTENVTGTPTLALGGGEIDEDGKDGTSYTDADWTVHEPGQAGAWEDVRVSGPDAYWIMTVNTTGWKDMTIRWDYKAWEIETDSFDLDYRVAGSGDWIEILNNESITGDKNWHSFSYDLSSITDIENLSMVEFRFYDLDQHGNGKFAFDNLELTGVPLESP